MGTTAMLDGRCVRVLPNDDPQLQTDIATPIYEDPVTRLKEEGIALIREVRDITGEPDFMEARVEFVDEPGESYWRRIYRK